MSSFHLRHSMLRVTKEWVLYRVETTLTLAARDSEAPQPNRLYAYRRRRYYWLTHHARPGNGRRASFYQPLDYAWLSAKVTRM